MHTMQLVTCNVVHIHLLKLSSTYYAPYTFSKPPIPKIIHCIVQYVPHGSNK